MSNAKVVIQQTPEGWSVEATEADDVIVTTSGNSVIVAVHPDDDDGGHGKPLDVALG